MMDVVEESREVFYARNQLGLVGDAELLFLKERAAGNARRRSRLCLHESTNERLHEMIIVHHQKTYVRPHRHLAKSEGLAVIEGQATLITYEDTGDLSAVVELAPATARAAFFYRMPEWIWHSLLIRSEWFVFVETTIGPFERTATEFASWAPDGEDPAAAAEYMRRLALRIAI